MADDKLTATELAAKMGADNGVSTGGTVILPFRPGTSADESKRAQSTAVYLDGNGRRKVVAAGDVVPDGWSVDEQVDLDARAENTVTRDEDDGSGGASSNRRRRSA